MGWNHRVMRCLDPNGDVTYGVHEVHYDKAGKISGWTEDAVEVTSDSRDGILLVLAQMAEAIALPILDIATGIIVESDKVQSDSFVSMLGRVKYEIDGDLPERRLDRIAADLGGVKGGGDG